MVALGDAAGDLQVDTLIGYRLARDQFSNDRGPLPIGMGIHEPDAVEATLQSSQMLCKAIGLSLVYRHELVHAVPIDESTVEHRDLGLFQRKKIAVEIDDHAFLSLDVAPISGTTAAACSPPDPSDRAGSCRRTGTRN